jgi:hypothetical protein
VATRGATSAEGLFHKRPWLADGIVVAWTSLATDGVLPAVADQGHESVRSWAYYLLGSRVEVVLLLFITRTAWTWRTKETEVLLDRDGRMSVL